MQTVRWVKRPTAYLESCRMRYGDVFTMRLMHEGTWVLFSHPEAVKQIFTGSPEVFHAGEANSILAPVLGSHSVLVLDERPHMVQRKLMLPAFHGERMHRYRELIADVASRELSLWPRREAVALAPRMQALTLEVIMRAVFGVREADRLEELRRRLRAFLDATSNPRVWAVLVLLGPERGVGTAPFRRALGRVDAVIYDEIRRRREAPDLQERDDILSMLLGARHEDGSPMTDAELRDELMTLLVAGHETTASALSWALERLVRHPHKLERLRTEALAGGDEYVDAVAKETLRLRPILPLVVRRLTEPVAIAGHELPAGTTVACCIYLMHRRPEVYPDPGAFRPERFLEQPAGTYTWIPFGGGVRRCLGGSFAMFEMKTVLQTLAASASLAPADPRAEHVRRRAITFVPERGAEVVVGDAVAPAGEKVAA